MLWEMELLAKRVLYLDPSCLLEGLCSPCFCHCRLCIWSFFCLTVLPSLRIAPRSCGFRSLVFKGCALSFPSSFCYRPVSSPSRAVAAFVYFFPHSCSLSHSRAYLNVIQTGIITHQVHAFIAPTTGFILMSFDSLVLGKR